MVIRGDDRPSILWFFFGWSGRISRGAYGLGWAFWLMALSASFARIFTVPEEDQTFVGWAILFFAIALLSTISSLMMTIKRLKDMNLPWQLVICLLIPAVSFFALLVFLLWPGTPGPNQNGAFSDRPKQWPARG